MAVLVTAIHCAVRSLRTGRDASTAEQRQPGLDARNGCGHDESSVLPATTLPSWPCLSRPSIALSARSGRAEMRQPRNSVNRDWMPATSAGMTEFGVQPLSVMACSLAPGLACTRTCSECSGCHGHPLPVCRSENPFHRQSQRHGAGIFGLRPRLQRMIAGGLDVAELPLQIRPNGRTRRRRPAPWHARPPRWRDASASCRADHHLVDGGGRRRVEAHGRQHRLDAQGGHRPARSPCGPRARSHAGSAPSSSPGRWRCRAHSPPRRDRRSRRAGTRWWR